MKTNIVVISLLDRFNKEIAIKLSENYDMYLADVADILEYNLVNEGEIEKICGADYLNSLKDKIIKEVSTYENTLITMPHNIFLEKSNAEYFKQYCTIVFLKFPEKVLKKIEKKTKKDKTRKEMKMLALTYKEHTKMCEDISDVTIDLQKNDIDVAYKKVEKLIDKYYL